ncbi:hypothetical protein AB0471_39265, partial [Streptomyces sp. NPDC052002]
MPMRTQQMTSSTARRSVPGFFLVLGVVCLVAAAFGGRLAIGLVTFGILAVCSFALEALTKGGGGVTVGLGARWCGCGQETVTAVG